MAFMMPVVRNNYEIYPAATKQQQISRSRRTSSCRSSNCSRPGSRTVSESGKNNADVILSPPARLNRMAGSVNSTGSVNLSRSAPSSSAFARPPSQRTVRFIRSASQESNYRRRRSDSAAGAIGSSSSTGSSNSSASNMDATALAELASSPKTSSLSKFHMRLVNKLKRKLGIKDDEVCVSEDDATVVRSST